MITLTIAYILKATITLYVPSLHEGGRWFLAAMIAPFAFGTSLQVLANGCLLATHRRVRMNIHQSYFTLVFTFLLYSIQRCPRHSPQSCLLGINGWNRSRVES